MLEVSFERLIGVGIFVLPDPYQTPQDERKHEKTPPPRWWLPFLVSVLFTPLAMSLAVLSFGYGHGNGNASYVLFPLYRSVRIVLNSEVTAEYLIYLLQYPVYGVVLSFGARHRRFRMTLIAVCVFHFACYFGRGLIADVLQEVGF